MRIILFATILLLAGCGSGDTSSTVTQEDIVKSYQIDRLTNETYYFPAKQQTNSATVFQSLERFDLIFVGHDFNSTDASLAYMIPGTYTHMLIYLGKDSQGFAYAVEMNVDENQSVGIDDERGVLKIDGRLHVYCLGSDFGHKACPKDLYIYGMETYDYMWAKQLNRELRSQLMQHENELIETMKEDLVTAFPFQLPFNIGVTTLLGFDKDIPLVDDGRDNGADCTAYITSLFEEIGGVCLDTVRIGADDLIAYYLDDPIGQQAQLPGEYNPFGSEDVYFSELITQEGYLFIDSEPRQTLCSESTGIPTPDLVFESPNLVDIDPVDEPIESN